LFDNTLKTLIFIGLELFHSLQDFFPNGLVVRIKDIGTSAISIRRDKPRTWCRINTSSYYSIRCFRRGDSMGAPLSMMQ
jgi:hypothetical protein